MCQTIIIYQNRRYKQYFRLVLTEFCSAFFYIYFKYIRRSFGLKNLYCSAHRSSPSIIIIKSKSFSPLKYLSLKSFKPFVYLHFPNNELLLCRILRQILFHIQVQYSLTKLSTVSQAVNSLRGYVPMYLNHRNIIFSSLYFPSFFCLFNCINSLCKSQ